MLLLCVAAFVGLCILVFRGLVFKPENRLLVSMLSVFSSALFGFVLTLGGDTDAQWAVVVGGCLFYGAPVVGIATFLVLKRLFPGEIP